MKFVERFASRPRISPYKPFGPARGASVHPPQDGGRGPR